jgi:hypothetical protein
MGAHIDPDELVQEVDSYNAEPGHMLLVWGILIVFVVVCLIVAKRNLKNLRKE